MYSLYEEKMSKIPPEESSQIKDVMIRYSILYHKDFRKIRRYDDYTEMLVKEMIRLRKIGVIYKDIAQYLSNKGYKSSRGKQLTGKLVERMIQFTSNKNVLFLFPLRVPFFPDLSKTNKSFKPSRSRSIFEN